MLNSSKIAAATQGFRAVFFSALAAGQLDAIVAKLASRIQTSNEEETYGWLEQISGMREFAGDAQINKIAANSYTIRNKEYEHTVEVKVRDVENDSLGQYSKLFQAMADGAISHDGEMIADLLVNGFSRPCYDGGNFFNTNHKYLSGAEYSNVMTKKLSAANFRTARQMLRTMIRPDGGSMRLGKDMHLIVGAANEGLAREILTAERNAAGATNVDKDTAKVAVWAEIDVINPNAWFVADLGQVLTPMIIQEEKPVEFRHVDNPNSEVAVKQNKFLYQAYKVAGYGYAFPQLIVGSDGTAAA